MLTPDGYKKRLIEKQFDEYMQIFGAVCIEGPKYCGKTWTGRSRSESAAFIGDPANNFQTRTMASISPDLVLKGDNPRLIDEWQEVPPIWDAIRFEVDKDNKKGKFILTGSATPNHKGIMHSGTARIGRVRMGTMSLFEIGDSTGKVSLRELFDDKLTTQLTGDVELKRLIYYAVRGGWPGNIDTPESICGNLATEYLKAVVDDDMYKVDGIKRDSRKVWSLIRSLGRNESTLVSNNKLRRDMGAMDEITVDSNTVSDYLDILNRLFLIDDQPAYSTNLRSSRRLLKSAKRHYIDPSLAVAALSATPDMLYNDLNTFGFIFENLCEHDLKIYAEYNGAKLYHYRDEKDNEADAVVEFSDGTWGAFEIKLGANQVDAAATELLKLRSIMEKEGDNPPKVLCVICGMTNMAYRREDGVYVVPITALGP
ncbi:MAG: ATP-binding protein [Lachnospiraceae bacterium]|nr:ATP-binding protein [Lachnospiraceae bacterium]MBQ4067840.1 ATP-binding protein [Lachnospiraceae bacterium]